MNTIGVILSASCLLVAIVEVCWRSEMGGRRIASMLASAAWAHRGIVGLDQTRMTELMEEHLRHERRGLRMAALLAAAAWAAMGFVALDQNRQCSAMMQQRNAAVTIPAKQIIADALRDTWKYESPEGGVITYESPAQAQAQLVGADEWHATHKNKL